MANFNPGLNPTSDPDYERSASTVNLFNPEAQNREASNRAVMGGFAALGAAVKGADRAVQESTRGELQKDFDRLNGSQGVDLAAGAAVVNPEGTAANPLAGDKPPTDEQKFIAEGMQRYKAAYDQGKISNTQYYAQLEAMVRSVKSRYPGYSEIIDRQIEGIAGVKPANALRQSMMHDMAKAEEQAQAKWDADQRYVEQHNNHLSAENYQKFQKNEISAQEAKALIQESRAKDQEIQAKTADLSFKAANNRLTQEETLKSSYEVAELIADQGIGDLKTLAEEADKQIAAGTFDPAKFALVVHKHRLDHQGLAQKKLFGALGGKVDVKEINTVVNDALRRYDDYAQVFTKEGVGYLSALKQELESRKDRDILGLIKDDKVGPTLRTVQAVKALGGENAAAVVIDRLYKETDIGTSAKNAINRMDAPTKEIVGSQTTHMGLGDKQLGDAKLVFENLVKTNRDTPHAIQNVLRLWKDNLTNPALGDQWVKNSAEVLFDAKNKNLLRETFKDPESRRQAFMMIASPEVTANMQKFKSDPVYKAYKEWVYNNYLTVMSDATNSLANVASRPYLDLVFDEKTGHLDLVPNKEGEALARTKWSEMSMARGVAYALESVLGRDLRGTVNALNEATDNVGKILEGDNYVTGENIKNLLAAKAAAAPKEKQGLWTWIARALHTTNKPKDLIDLEFGGTHPNFTQASGTDGEPRGLVSLIDKPEQAIDALKNAFAKGESGGNYNRLVDTPTHPREINLTSMPIRDVLAYQQDMLDKGNKSSAAGKYQVVSKTLRSLVREGVVSEDDVYNEATQEKIADALLERRGLNAFLNGRMSLRRFMSGLGDEWEVIKRSPLAYHKTMLELERLKARRSSEIASAN